MDGITEEIRIGFLEKLSSIPRDKEPSVGELNGSLGSSIEGSKDAREEWCEVTCVRMSGSGICEEISGASGIVEGGDGSTGSSPLGLEGGENMLEEE